MRHTNAVTGFCLGLALCACGHPPPTARRSPNVLLIVLDTTRADRVSSYGYPRATTAAIDRLAATGVRFERAYATSSWTLDSHASMFTGRYPVGHRATQETLRLDERLPTLAELLARAGYRTFGSSANPVVSSENGLARGFESFVETFRAPAAPEAEHPNNAAFRAFLASTPHDRPFFAFVNYIEAHLPYDPPPGIRSRFVRGSVPLPELDRARRLGMVDHYLFGPLDDRQLALLSDLYDGEVATVDEQVGRLLEILAQDGRAEDTLVVVTADHGENLGEHGHFAHVFDIHDTLLHVPLIVRPVRSGPVGTTRHDVVTLLDLFPTILAQCGVAPRDPGPGRDVFTLPVRSDDDVVMAEYYYPRQVLSTLDPEALAANVAKFVPYMRRLRAVRDGRFKLIWGSSGPRELYDLVRDPDERDDLLLREPGHPARARLEAAMHRLVARDQGEIPLGPPPPVGWMVPGFEQRPDDPEWLEKLRSLGYVR